MKTEETKFYTVNGITAQRGINYQNFTPDNNVYPVYPQPSDVPDYSGYCFHRLPCGICKLTNMPCPKMGVSQPNVTWVSDKTNVFDDMLNHSQSDCKEPYKQVLKQ